MNDAAEGLFGYTRPELVGQRVELLVPDERRSMHGIYREIYQERPERRPMGSGLELTAQRKDDTVFPVEISLSPVRDAGSVLSMAVVRDVSRQRRAEEALRRSEERHRLLNERAENVIFRYRLLPASGFEYVSAASTRRLGYRPEDLYVDRGLVRRLAHEEDRPLLEEALRSAQPATYTLRLRVRSGELRWFDLVVAPVHTEEGALVALEGLLIDVTERRAAEEERQRLETEVEMQLERTRIAGDLHDDTIQSIYALGLGLHSARNDVAVTKENAIDRTIEGLNAVIAGLRTYMEQLRGADDDREHDSLEQRLRALLTLDGTGPRWDVAVDADVALDPAAERHLYLLAKELVSNVERHAEASSASLRLHGAEGSGGFELVVEDDGVGFAREEVGGGSFGLRSMEMRANALGAALEIETAPGCGTRVSIRAPYSTDGRSPH